MEAGMRTNRQERGGRDAPLKRVIYAQPQVRTGINGSLGFHIEPASKLHAGKDVQAAVEIEVAEIDVVVAGLGRLEIPVAEDDGRAEAYIGVPTALPDAHGNS